MESRVCVTFDFWSCLVLNIKKNQLNNHLEVFFLSFLNYNLIDLIDVFFENSKFLFLTTAWTNEIVHILDRNNLEHSRDL